jgi:hypothetical protein
MKTTHCDEGHGRIAWLGHVECTDCERIHKHQPARCLCGSMTFRAMCAKCFGVESRASCAPTSFAMSGELPVPGHGAPIE